jgi:thiamine biosynthesis lipoprotein
MGAVYHITAECPVGILQQADIDHELDWVNSVMSTYVQKSTLSRFNQLGTDTWMSVEPELLEVIEVALELSRKSDGAYDITVGPLVNLWGFGPQSDDSAEPPTESQITQVLGRIGHSSIELRQQPPALLKHKNLYLDLSSIAKGYGVDRVAELLSQSQCANYLVDIGGEVRTQGLSPKSRSWRIGIEVPEAESFGAINRIVQLPDVAVATSGDYRNFIEWNGTNYSHIIDPRTGYPVTHSLASVTVLHHSAMKADAIATLLTVLGPDEGWLYAQKTGLAVLFVWRTDNGFEQRHTQSFGPYLVD